MILTCIKIYALACLIFAVVTGGSGYRLYKARERDEARRESRWWLSPVIQHHAIEPIQPIIRTFQ